MTPDDDVQLVKAFTATVRKTMGEQGISQLFNADQTDTIYLKLFY
jgi:hypothetical protein